MTEGIQFSERDFKDFSRFIRERTGILLQHEKRSELQRKLANDRVTIGVKNSGDFIRRVKDSKEALQNLVNHLTIGESYFFRNRPHFDALQKRIFPRLIEEAKNRRTLRIWSAGCARGEEPYSIAILLRRCFPQIKDWKLIIQATDINTSFLEQAKQAVYPKWSMRGVEKELLAKYFTVCEHDRYRLDSRIQSLVTFKWHNLNNRDYTNTLDRERWDLILCRNVLIYFSYEDYMKIVEAFEQTLCPRGYLIMGHSEVLPQSSMLEINYSDATYYYSRSGGKSGTVERAKNYVSRMSMPGIGLPSVLPIASKKPVVNPKLPPASPVPVFSQPHPPQTALPQTAVPLNRNETERNDSAFEEACRYANSGALDKAHQTLHTTLQKGNSVDYRIHYLYAMVADQLGKSVQAQASLKQVIFLNKKFVVGHFYLASIYEREGNYKQAQKHYRNVWRLLEGAPDSAPVEGAEGLTVGRLREITGARLRETSL